MSKMRIGYSSETKEHKIMKKVVIKELKNLGYPDSAIHTEEIIKGITPRRYLSGFWFKEFHEMKGLSEIGAVKKILNTKEYSTSAKPRVDIVLKRDEEYIAFFETERSWYPKPLFDAKKKGLEVASIRNNAKLVFVVKENRRSFNKIVGLVLDGIWRVNIKKEKIVEKIGWDGK